MKTFFLSLLIIFLNIFILSLNAFGSVTCSLSGQFAHPTANIQGVPTISVTPDLPVGTVLFQGRFINKYQANSYSCSKDSGSASVETLSMIEKTTVVGGSSIDNHTFQTNIPGVGIQFWIVGGYILNDGSKTADTYKNTNIGPGWSITNGITNFDREMTFFLVKTGNVTPGMLNAASFPSVNYTWQDSGSTSPVNGLPFSEITFSFTGQLNITVPSCQTPGDFSVNLGTFETSLLNKNTSTPWTDVGLKLTNCPAFTGYSTSSDSQFLLTTPGSTTLPIGSLAAFKANILGITLTPLNQVINATQGIMGLDTSSGNSAGGVAVQLASGTTVSQTPVSLGAESQQALSMTTSPTEITIPLVARMIKQGSMVTPGPVISKVTYLINYK